MKKALSLVALGALSISLVAATGCKGGEEKKEGATTEAPKVVEETPSTGTATTATTASTESTAATAATATATTGTTGTAPATK